MSGQQARILVPNSGEQVVVGQIQRTVINRPGQEALLALLEPFLRRVEWELIASYSNRSSSYQKVELQTRTRLTVTNGIEASTNLNIPGSFAGLTFTFGGTTKTFTPAETTEAGVQATKTYSLEPMKTLYIYQRRYTFRERVWWIMDAWGKYWTAGNDGNNETIQASILLHIYADEFLTSEVELTDQQAVYVQPASRPRTEDQWQVLQYASLSANAKNSITGTLNSAARTVN
ncbi:unnamed protein product [Rhizoctonia solani]|uniref:Uncharacterized protein n=1 Tax=Rhizoctonia solani TaxID=456999 RepID=A0A8H3E857_9AGAM|nr:unnamed protein product [Rhizoctonia solani]